jgi:hypothetical protein
VTAEPDSARSARERRPIPTDRTPMTMKAALQAGLA